MVSIHLAEKKLSDLVFLSGGESDSFRLKIARDLTRTILSNTPEELTLEYLNCLVIDESMHPHWRTASILSAQLDFTLIVFGAREYSHYLIDEVATLIKPDDILTISFEPEKKGELVLKVIEDWPLSVYSTKILQELENRRY